MTACRAKPISAAVNQSTPRSFCPRLGASASVLVRSPGLGVFSLLLSVCSGTAALSGIVRTIDPVTHQFLVLTSVPPERLQRVNTFVKGAIHLPAPTLLRGVR